MKTEIVHTVRVQYETMQEYVKDSEVKKNVGYVEAGYFSTPYPLITWKLTTAKED